MRSTRVRSTRVPSPTGSADALTPAIAGVGASDATCRPRRAAARAFAYHVTIAAEAPTIRAAPADAAGTPARSAAPPAADADARRAALVAALVAILAERTRTAPTARRIAPAPPNGV